MRRVRGMEVKTHDFHVFFIPSIPHALPFILLPSYFLRFLWDSFLSGGATRNSARRDSLVALELTLRRREFGRSGYLAVSE